MLFQIGIMLKLLLFFPFGIMFKKKLTLLLTTECAYGPPASVYRHSPG